MQIVRQCRITYYWTKMVVLWRICKVVHTVSGTDSFF